MAFTPFTPDEYPTMANFNQKLQSIHDDAVLSALGGSNPNLLDNWYFVDPINQRGEASYNGIHWGKTYGMDRWYLSRAQWAVATHTLTANADFGRMMQSLDPNLTKAIAGETVTLSYFFHEPTTDEVATLVTVFTETGATDIGSVKVSRGFVGVLSASFVLPDPGTGHIDVGYYVSAEGTNARPVAAKLELGSQQTLAHQDENGNWVLNDPPPDKALERLKCQRYYQRIPTVVTSASSPWDFYNQSVIFPVQMRACPTPTIIAPVNQNEKDKISVYRNSEWITVPAEVRDITDSYAAVGVPAGLTVGEAVRWGLILDSEL